MQGLFFCKKIFYMVHIDLLTRTLKNVIIFIVDLYEREAYMAIKNSRFNVDFADDAADLLSTLAKQEHKTVSLFIQELVFEALYHREDMVLSAIAEFRDTKDAKVVDHEDVWK